MRRLKTVCVSVALLLLILITGCGKTSMETVSNDNGYNQISQEKAAGMMQEESGYIILDVRTKEEYAEGHIPGAICVPNEQIDCDPPEELPDYDQLIFVYCRTGRRSKEAAQKLASMGRCSPFL